MHYRITVRGHLDQHWSTWFEGLTITNGGNGEATLVGPVVDQAALYGVLIKIRDLGLPLIAITAERPAAQADTSTNDGSGASAINEITERTIQ